MHGSQVFLSLQQTSPTDGARCISPSRIEKDVRPFEVCADRLALKEP